MRDVRAAVIVARDGPGRRLSPEKSVNGSRRTRGHRTIFDCTLSGPGQERSGERRVAQVGLVREVMQPVRNRLTRCRGYPPRVQWSVPARHMGVEDSAGIETILGDDRAAGSGAPTGAEVTGRPRIRSCHHPISRPSGVCDEPLMMWAGLVCHLPFCADCWIWVVNQKIPPVWCASLKGARFQKSPSKPWRCGVFVQ